MKKIPTFISLALATLLVSCSTKDAVPTQIPSAPTAAVIIVEGHFLPEKNLFLIFPVAGRVEEILVAEGDQVTAGQVLARLGDDQQAEALSAAALLELILAQQDYDALVRTADLVHAQAWQAYDASQKARAAAQLAWDRLDRNAIQTSTDNAQTEVTARQTDLENALIDLERTIDLPADDATRNSFEARLRTAQINYDLAVQKLEDIISGAESVRFALDAALAMEAEARRAYENTQDGPDTEKMDLAQARLEAARAQADAAQAALGNYELKAPFSGTVMAINISIDEWAGPQAYAIALADTSTWWVDTSDLTELDVVNVSVGQSVEITADALPGVIMTGEVVSIGGAPEVLGGDILYKVRIQMEEVDPRIRWGMTVEATFTLEGE